MQIPTFDPSFSPIVSDASSQEQFLRSVLASSGDCIKIVDLDGNLTFMTDVAQEIMEVSDFNALRGCPWPDFWKDGLHQEAREALETARRGGEGRFEGMALTFGGTPKWWDVRITAIKNVQGPPAQLLVVSRDITVQKEAQEQQRLLMLELAHRVKNILTVVHAIALMSLRDGADMGPSRETFLARLMALAQAQDVLLQTTLHAKTLVQVLLSKIVAIHGNTQQFAMTGPDVLFGPRFALAFSLVIHELFTNALKYGALSCETGTVDISWQLSGLEHDRQFEMAWIELGGPTVAPPTRQGFGSKLIEGSLSRHATSSAQIIYEPGGAQFHLKIPLRDVLED